MTGTEVFLLALMLGTNVCTYLAAKRLVWRLIDQINIRLTRQSKVNQFLAEEILAVRDAKPRGSVLPFPTGRGGPGGPTPPSGGTH